VAALSESRTVPAAFGFIGAEHPFHDQIGPLREYITRSSAHSRLRARLEAGLPACIHAEIKGDYQADGWTLERCYYSIQYPEPSRPGGYYAWSLHYRRGDAAPRIVEFPCDPKLATLQRLWSAVPAGGEQVLRYVPLRRLTFLQPADRSGPARIGKVKKPHRCADGYARLQAVASAGEAGCSIPRPLGLDLEQGLFYQEKLPGEEAGRLLNWRNYQDYLTGIGEVHARLRRLPTARMERWDRCGVLANVWTDLHWIGFHLPEHQALLERVGHRLHRRMATLTPVEAAFCHGDFACSQVLCHELGWSVVDFDLSGVGDPYQDAAMFLASLAYDVPLFSHRPELLDAAAGYYLCGYREAAPALDAATLDWYRACAEIYHLALMLKKDRHCDAACRRAMQRLCRLLEVH